MHNTTRDTVIVASSCQYPPDFFRHREAYTSLDEIAKLFAQLESPKPSRVLMLAGDSIYTDATAGLMDATDPHERFTQQYYKLKNNWAWRKIDANERLFSIDDHELIDDWVPLDTDHPDKKLLSKRLKTRDDGKKAFINEMQPYTKAGGNAYYKAAINDIPFFVMDSRTERSARNALNFNHVGMIGDGQMSSLRKWIDQLAENDNGKSDSAVAPKIILSGSMLFPRRHSTAQRWCDVASHARCLRSDGWDGYPQTMHRVLSYIAKKRLRKVIFVSGDAHIHCICDVVVSSEFGSINIKSVHGSALNAPLPFANAMEEEFQACESFALSAADNSDPLDIKVKTTFPDVGDGFSIIRARKVDGWQPCQISFAGKRRNYKPVLVDDGQWLG